MEVQPYLFFNGRCEEALDFYRTSIGADVTALMRFKESPGPQPPNMPPDFGDKVMHASFRVGSTTLFASDGRCEGAPTFQGFSLSIAAHDAAQAERLFTALSAGGTVTAPLTKTFFSPAFGMLTDRFGMGWMVIVMPSGG